MLATAERSPHLQERQELAKSFTIPYQGKDGFNVTLEFSYDDFALPAEADRPLFDSLAQQVGMPELHTRQDLPSFIEHALYHYKADGTREQLHENRDVMLLFPQNDEARRTIAGFLKNDTIKAPDNTDRCSGLYIETQKPGDTEPEQIQVLHMHAPFDGDPKTKCALIGLLNPTARNIQHKFYSNDEMVAGKSPIETVRNVAAIALERRSATKEQKNVEYDWGERHSAVAENTLALAKTTNQETATKLKQFVSQKFTGYSRFDKNMASDAVNFNKEQSAIFANSLQHARSEQHELAPENVADALRNLHDEPFTIEQDVAFLAEVISVDNVAFANSLEALTHQEILSLLVQELEITTRPEGAALTEQEEKILQLASILHENGYWFVNYQNTTDHGEGYHGEFKDGQLAMCSSHTPKQDAKLDQSLSFARHVLSLSQQTEMTQNQREMAPPPGGVITVSSTQSSPESSEAEYMPFSIQKNNGSPTKKRSVTRRTTYPSLASSSPKATSKEYFFEDKRPNAPESESPRRVIVGTTKTTAIYQKPASIALTIKSRTSKPEKPKDTIRKTDTFPAAFNLTTSEVVSPMKALTKSRLTLDARVIKTVDSGGFSELPITVVAAKDGTKNIYVNKKSKAPTAKKIREVSHVTPTAVTEPKVRRIYAKTNRTTKETPAERRSRPLPRTALKKSPIASTKRTIQKEASITRRVASSHETETKKPRTITVNARITTKSSRVSSLRASTVDATNATRIGSETTHTSSKRSGETPGKSDPRPSPKPRTFTTPVEFRAPLSAPAKEDVQLGNVLANLEQLQEEAQISLGTTDEQTSEIRTSEQNSGTSHGATVSQEASGDHKVTVVKTQAGQERFAVENSRRDVIAAPRTQRKTAHEELIAASSQTEAGTDERSEAGRQQAVSPSTNKQTIKATRSHAASIKTQQSTSQSSLAMSLPSTQFLSADPYLAKSAILGMLQA